MEDADGAAGGAAGSGTGSGGGGGGTNGVGSGGGAAPAQVASLTLVEGAVLGGGAFSRVCAVTEASTGRAYALKRMRKAVVAQCPDHVFCEQAITKNTAHPFCIRQYASFQVRAGGGLE